LPIAEKPQTDFKRVLLFKAGKFNGVTTTPDDLRSMVAFSKEHENILPDLKIDHIDDKENRDSKFKVFENFPFSLGKITNLEYNEDEKALYGDYINVFEPVKNAIDDKLLTTHSAEIYYNVASKKTGKKYPAVLTAVAILPAGKPPALMEVFQPYMYELENYQGELSAFTEFEYQDKAFYQVGITDFPIQGENQQVSLYNTQYPIFDPDYAKDLKENYPEIWRKGGNIEGNNQYNRLLPIVTRDNKKPLTDTEDMAIRKREAWAARHLKDFRLPGVVAQIKWFVVGDNGEGYMKRLINEEKKKYKKSFSMEGMMDKGMYEAKMESFGCGSKKMSYESFQKLSDDEKQQYLDIMKNLSMKEGESEEEDDMPMVEKEPEKMPVGKFSVEAVLKKNEELEKKLNSLVEAEGRRADILEARIQEYERKAKSEKVDKVIFSLSGADNLKLLPSMADKARALLMAADESQKVNYSVEGQTVEKSQFDLTVEFLNNLPSQKAVFSAKSIVASQDDVSVSEDEIKGGLSIDSVLAVKKIAKKYGQEKDLTRMSESELLNMYAGEGLI
jgi:hypothetical protein